MNLNINQVNVYCILKFAHYGKCQLMRVVQRTLLEQSGHYLTLNNCSFPVQCSPHHW